MRILAVEDNKDLRHLLGVYLEAQDHEYVRTAASGADALTIIKDTPVPFDCFLLDIQMPEMSGIELITYIRQIPGYEFVPIIMLTGVKNSDSIAKAFVAGAWDYIVKPFEFFELETRIHGAELRNAEFIRHIKRPHESPSREKYEVLQKIALERPMTPADLSKSGLVTEEAFGNYIMRMQSEFGGDTTVAVIAVQNFTQLMASFSEPQRHQYTVKLAVAISEALKPMGLMLTYRSNGIFAAALLDAEMQTNSSMDKAVAKAVASVELENA
ncbi:response regulator, partial [Litorimonas sp.]|uniref:response regulator n=1 Tax=Litorimonas sp. TaxID=1892381 RepID=UPI003A864696